MRRLIIAFILFGLIHPSKSTAQCSPVFQYQNAGIIKFTGVAPQPWGINGLTDDWETILGPYTGNNDVPYNIIAGLNSSREFTDADAPPSTVDIRHMSFTYDDYNVYFYLRKLKNSSTNFFYFFDTNADGLMSNTELVLGGKTPPGNSNSNNNELTLYRYVPPTGQTTVPLGNPVVDGYTMPGSTEKLFDNHTIPPANSLLPNEVFAIRSTENGFGVEFAIPWRYLGLNPGLIFTYHIALLKAQSQGNQTQTGYQPQLVEDNAGSCCGRLLFSGLPDYTITNSSIVPLGNLSYKMLVTVQNIKNARLRFVLNEMNFTNITLNPGIPFSRDDFSVSVGGQSPLFHYGTISQQPIIYSYQNLEDFSDIDLRPVFTLDAFNSTTIEINFSLPANNSVAQLSAGVSFSDAFFAPTGPFPASLPGLLYCPSTGSSDGPRGTRPVVIEVTTENKNKRLTNVNETNNQPGNSLKVFPNPSKGSATVVIPQNGLKGELRLEDVTGKLIYRKINTTGSTVTLQNLKSGFYLLRYTDQVSGKQYIEKLIVQ